MSGLSVGRFSVPESELDWSFSTSGGPGGQHANRSNTRVELRYDVQHSDVFPSEVRRRILDALAPRLVGGTLVVSVDDSRSQFRNRSIARRRMGSLITEAMKPPTPRKRTRPTKASNRKRLEEKRRRAETKRLRQPPDAR